MGRYGLKFFDDMKEKTIMMSVRFYKIFVNDQASPFFSLFHLSLNSIVHVSRDIATYNDKK